jgi:phosphatidylglycerophosphatase A
MRKISKLVATLFFIGYSPVAPGTLASLLALGLYILIGHCGTLYILLTGASLLLGFWSSARAEKEFSRKDPPQIVIDEFSAMLAAYFFIPARPDLIIIGFVLFRLFDIFKFPRLKKLESLPSGYGIMLDDIAAAMLTNIILQLLRCFPR